MTYLVLARKWRPRSFDTLVGQDHVVRALTQALATQRLHHAWLFTGTRGVGKTTLSRILAKALNCQTGITPEPCGQCEACLGIDADRYVDYLELDAASNRGVEEMTRLLEQAVYAPSAGRFKVYMIDEVHMLTGHAFNAMLKTLEEPPPHVKFILATTDPQKIPVTVLSRCLQFNLKQMPPEAISGHLTQVLEAEGVPAELPALRLISHAARGSMRDALSLTDQAIAYSGGSVSEEAVRGMLGTIDQRYLVRLLDALVAGDGPALVAVADELATRSLSYSAALGDLAALLSQIAMAQRIPGLPPDDAPMVDDIRRLAAAMDGDAVQLFYSIALHSRSELSLAPDEYAGFVMACLRMLAFGGTESTPVLDEGADQPAATPPAPRPAAPREVSGGAADGAADGVAAARAAVAALQRGGAGRKAAPGPSTSPTAVDVETTPAAAPQPASNPAPSPAAPPGGSASALRAQQSVKATVASPQSQPLSAAAPASEPPPWDVEPHQNDASDANSTAFSADQDAFVTKNAPEGPAEESDVLSSTARTVIENVATPPAEGAGGIVLNGPWHELAVSLPLKGMAAELARQAEWVGVDGATITLKVATRALAQGPAADRLRAALAKHFGTAVQVRMEVGATGNETAHAVAESARAARQREAETVIQADPFVQTLVAQFGGEIVPGSIRPGQDT